MIHDLTTFVSLNGCYYPNLVRVFYSNLYQDSDSGYLIFEMKGKRMVLTPEVLSEVGGLSTNGIIPNTTQLKNAGFELRKEAFYMSLLKDSTNWEAANAVKEIKEENHL